LTLLIIIPRSFDSHRSLTVLSSRLFADGSHRDGVGSAHALRLDAIDELSSQVLSGKVGVTLGLFPFRLLLRRRGLQVV
jgi:hypothetical protein